MNSGYVEKGIPQVSRPLKVRSRNKILRIQGYPKPVGHRIVDIKASSHKTREGEGLKEGLWSYSSCIGLGAISTVRIENQEWGVGRVEQMRHSKDIKSHKGQVIKKH